MIKEPTLHMYFIMTEKIMGDEEVSLFRELISKK
jgi:hypothetical protein